MSARAPRLFVDEELRTGERVDAGPDAARYLLSVMRLSEGDEVLLFDDRTGEWRAEIVEAGKRRVALLPAERLRVREAVPDIWLCAAPVKRGRYEWMAEKACELGAARFVPLLTERTVVRSVKADRLRAHMVEAAEQCGRTALPQLGELTSLPQLLAGWPDTRALVFCDEESGAEGGGEGGEKSGVRTLQVLRDCPAPAAILIGPEGGFSAAERQAILQLLAARRISLGPRVLRADTAAVAALALWQAAAGA